uniref:C-X-C motif chemokine 10-like n=1 Tax=Scatophagus argus TaxID=75038 RepID=UPI001ED7E78F|nr:C-X-C motif chemokine 10-like [Scatophagus argus]
MKSAVLAFLVCLLVFCAQGHPDYSSSKCKCLNGYIEKIHPKLIKAGPFVHDPSVFCPHTEIIIKTANKDKCVNPNSPLGKLILRNKNKHENNGTRSTSASSSTRPHTTSSL